MMFVPGNNPGMMADAHIYGPDSIMLDLEDSVTMAEKDAAQYHTIKQGDTLGALARKYHTTVKKICQLNGISERTVLRIGKKLRVK